MQLNIRITSTLFLVALIIISCREQHTIKDEPVKAIDTISTAPGENKSELTALSTDNSMQELLSQGWELEEDVEAINDNNEPVGILPFRSYYLSPDSTFVKNPRNAIEFGKWLYNDDAKTITLLYKSGSKDLYKIGALATDELVVVNKGIGSETKLKFISSGMKYLDFKNDPFCVTNNHWRIHPKKAETKDELHKRVEDYLHFYVLFYKDNVSKKSKTISFYGLPTCFKWYAGGIYMIKKDQLNENWKHCFYNDAQAMEAYKMIEQLMTQKYNWPKGNISWVNKNLAVLEQMYARF